MAPSQTDEEVEDTADVVGFPCVQVTDFTAKLVGLYTQAARFLGLCVYCFCTQFIVVYRFARLVGTPPCWALRSSYRFHSEGGCNPTWLGSTLMPHASSVFASTLLHSGHYSRSVRMACLHPTLLGSAYKLQISQQRPVLPHLAGLYTQAVCFFGLCVNLTALSLL